MEMLKRPENSVTPKSWGSEITIHRKGALEAAKGLEKRAQGKPGPFNGGQENGDGGDEDSELRKGEGRGSEEGLVGESARVLGCGCLGSGLHLGWDGEGKTGGGVPT